MAQVVLLREQVSKTQIELEDFIISHLRKHPALAAYAHRPLVTYLLWIFLTAPFVAVLPLFFRGELPLNSHWSGLSSVVACDVEACPHA